MIIINKKSKVPNRFLPLLLDFEERKGPLLIEYEKRLTKFAYANYLQQKTGNFYFFFFF